MIAYRGWLRNSVVGTILLSIVGCGYWAMAEQIVLKNGTSITADRVLQRGTEVIYQLGSTSYKIPSSSVLRIVHDSTSGVTLGAPSTMKITVETAKPDAWTAATGRVAAPTSQAPRAGRPKLEVAPPSESPHSGEEAALLKKLIVDGQLDERALADIEKNSPPPIAAAADFLTGKFQMEQGDAAAAPAYFHRAAKLAPQMPVLLAWYAASLMKIGKNADAVAAAKEAADKSPDSAEALRLLGAAYYNDDKTKDALAAWKKSLDIRADDYVQKLVEKAQREMDSEESFREQESEHFVVRYDGGQVSPELQQHILATLESAFRDLEHELDFTPSQTIPVILYARKAFFDITAAPTWAGGVNDGKLRIPVEGLQEMNPKLERILRHELTHSFVGAITRRSCPSWLNEGLAQMMEPKSSSPDMQQLAAMFQRNGQAPMKDLENPFNGLGEDQARIAYAESLAAVEYLRSKYGMDDVLAILKAISQGQTPESALKTRTHDDYGEFEKELGNYLSGNLAASDSGSGNSSH